VVCVSCSIICAATTTFTLTRTDTHTHTHTHTRARIHTHTHTHTHRDMVAGANDDGLSRQRGMANAPPHRAIQQAMVGKPPKPPTNAPATRRNAQLHQQQLQLQRQQQRQPLLQGQKAANPTQDPCQPFPLTLDSQVDGCTHNVKGWTLLQRTTL